MIEEYIDLDWIARNSHDPNMGLITIYCPTVERMVNYMGRLVALGACTDKIIFDAPPHDVQNNV